MKKQFRKLYKSEEGSLAIMLVIVILTAAVTAGLTISTTRITRLQFVQDTQEVTLARGAANATRDLVFNKINEAGSEKEISEYYHANVPIPPQTNCDLDVWEWAPVTGHQFCLRSLGYVDNESASIPKQLEKYEILARAVFPTGDVVGRSILTVEAPYSNFIKLTLDAADVGSTDGLGQSIDIDGDRIAVGAPCDCGNGTGRVFIFDWATSTKTWSYKILNPTLDPLGPNVMGVGQRFGHDVSLHGDWLAVGARRNEVGVNTNSGAVYLYKRKADNSWEEKQFIQPQFDGAGDASPPVFTNDLFGGSVAIYGSWLAIGAEGNNDNGEGGAGIVYMYRKNSSDIWEFQNVINPWSLEAFSHFGSEVVMYDNYLAVAARTKNNGVNQGAGEVYIYKLIGTNWDAFKIISPPIPSPQAHFGWAIDIHKNSLIIGEHEHDNPDNPIEDPPREKDPGISNRGGDAYIYQFDGVTWQKQRKIYSYHNPQTDERFGSSVAIYGNVAASGADDINGGPFVSVREKDSKFAEDVWLERIELTSGVANDNFFIVDMNDRWLAVGAPGDDEKATDSGAIYIFDR